MSDRQRSFSPEVWFLYIRLLPLWLSAYISQATAGNGISETGQTPLRDSRGSTQEPYDSPALLKSQIDCLEAENRRLKQVIASAGLDDRTQRWVYNEDDPSALSSPASPRGSPTFEKDDLGPAIPEDASDNLFSGISVTLERPWSQRTRYSIIWFSYNHVASPQLLQRILLIHKIENTKSPLLTIVWNPTALTAPIVTTT